MDPRGLLSERRPTLLQTIGLTMKWYISRRLSALRREAYFGRSYDPAPTATDDAMPGSTIRQKPHAHVSRCTIRDGTIFLSRIRESDAFTMILFTAVVMFLFSDHNLLAPNMSAVAEEFGFSDEVSHKDDSLDTAHVAFLS